MPSDSMPSRFRVSLAQLNPIVGDLAGNLEKACGAHQEAAAQGADLLALPEMFLSGYQTQDLVLKPAFLADVSQHLALLAKRCADGPAIGIGAPIVQDGLLYNAYLIYQNGAELARILKHHLPNSREFDEERHFAHGPITGPFSLNGVRIGAAICEDAWYDDPCETLAETGAEILLTANGSPYHRGKHETRIQAMVAQTVATALPLIYLNMIGGQDDQLFDGASFVLEGSGALAVQLPMCEAMVQPVDFVKTAHGWVPQQGPRALLPDEWEADYQVMCAGLREYMEKTGFKTALLGLSGGVDSALVAMIAVDALGAEAVRGVMLPSAYTSQASLDDAAELAKRLGIQLDTLSIEPMRAAAEASLAPLFEGYAPDLTEENIQSRIRGMLLMALSNKTGAMLLTTGNKSEVAVGYATIYGDMAGGYNPIKDLYKMRVFETCRWRNRTHRSWMLGPSGAVIPEEIIEKAPSAELRADQKDSDSLPDYPVLDGILEMLIEGDASVAECVAAGFAREDVKKIERLLYLSEYKRFQAAPGVRLAKAFWLDRRYPIVNHWRDPS